MKNDILNQIAITIDIDWVGDEIIRYTVNLLDRYHVKATFFATHNSNYLKTLDNSRYEIGLHPDFEQSSDYNKTIGALRELYPEAVGIRSHCLFQSSRLLQVFIDNGLSYEANSFIPLIAGLRPFSCLDRLVSIPCYWGDDYHYLAGFDFELSVLGINNPGLKVYMFHPIHIFTNTNSNSHYLKFKQHLKNPEMLKKFRQPENGIGVLFAKLLEYISENGLASYTCKEICTSYKGNNTK